MNYWSFRFDRSNKSKEESVNQILMYQIQLVARIIFGLIGDCGIEVEDLRDKPVNAVYRQTKAGMIIRFSDHFPYSIISPFGEWVLVGERRGTNEQKENLRHLISNLYSIRLVPLKGSSSEYWVAAIEGEELEHPKFYPHREDFIPPSLCRQNWEGYLGTYLADFHSSLVGQELELKATGLSALLHTSTGRKMQILDISPHGIVTGRDSSGHIRRGMSISSFMVFRPGLVP